MQAANFNNINLCNCQSTQLVVEQLLAENALLKSRIEWFNRHVYGQKQERFVAPEDSAQLCLQFGDEVIEVAPEDAKQIIAAHERIKQNKENAHKGRLPIPASLPRVDEVIEPEEDTSEMTRIGEDVTEIL